MKTNKLTIGALAVALVALLTLFPTIPLPLTRGFFNLGEAVIYLVAFIFGGPMAAIAGGLGAALADLLLNYSFYAPVTLVVKGLEGYLVGRLATRNKFLAVGVGALVLMVGYGLAAWFLTKKFEAAIVEAGVDLVQALVGGLIAIPLAEKLRTALGE